MAPYLYLINEIFLFSVLQTLSRSSIQYILPYTHAIGEHSMGHHCTHAETGHYSDYPIKIPHTKAAKLCPTKVGKLDPLVMTHIQAGLLSWVKRCVCVCHRIAIDLFALFCGVEGQITDCKMFSQIPDRLNHRVRSGHHFV